MGLRYCVGVTGSVAVWPPGREPLQRRRRPKGDTEPLKYWLSTLPEDRPLTRMVYAAKMRWRIERDDQDLKQDLGLGHYEGRGWRGFHHHASLSIAAYGFLLAQRLRQPDEIGGKKCAAQRPQPALPTHCKPRASPPRAAPRPILDHELANAYRIVAGAKSPAMSMLATGSRGALL